MPPFRERHTERAIASERDREMNQDAVLVVKSWKRGLHLRDQQAQTTNDTASKPAVATGYTNHRGQRGTRILHRRQSCTGGNSSSLPCASCHPCQPTRLHMGNKHEMPVLYGLYHGPVRRPLSADSEFFDAGNTARALLCKISVFALISGGDCDSMDFEDHQQQHYECMFRDCPATFSSLARHEAHYETSHRNRCCACGRSFPTHRLLDLHLSETHDSFFKAMAERRPMYACLVEACAEIFETSGKRHEHLVGAHRYPASFDFSRSSYSRKKARVKQRKDGRERGGNRTKSAGSGWKANGFARPEEFCAKSESAPALANAAAAEGSNTGVHDSVPVPADRLTRRQQRLQPINCPPTTDPRLLGAASVARRACKFWRTAAGCHAGDVCRYRHDATTATGGGGGGSGGGVTSAVAVGTGSSVSGVAGARGSIGARELLEPDGGAASGGVGAGLSGCGVNTSEIGGLSDGGIGAALGGGRVGENDYSGGVDE
ncbi:unnamed protein product, partial [Pylaiella littoralis]